MSWTRRNIRTVSALLVALIAYAAIPGAAPHLHDAVHHAAGGHHAAGARHATDAQHATDAGVLANAILIADEEHESHTPGLRLETHPCALCRDASARALAAATPPEPFCLEAIERAPCAPESVARRSELLLAERHPARAPPRA